MPRVEPTCSDLRSTGVDNALIADKMSTWSSRRSEEIGASWGMDTRSRSDDHQLVTDCLAGSEAAWKEFYARFAGLVKAVARKYSPHSAQDVEDYSQAAFLSLTTALREYDPRQSLPRFIGVVTERVIIDEYRKSKASKRDAAVESLRHDDSGEERSGSSHEEVELQDERLDKAQRASHLREALLALDSKCQRLLTLRYLDELSFKEVAEAMASTENTVTVQTRRCLEALRAKLTGRTTGGHPQ